MRRATGGAAPMSTATNDAVTGAGPNWAKVKDAIRRCLPDCQVEVVQHIVESECNDMAKSVELEWAHLTAVFSNRKVTSRVRQQRARISASVP